MVLVQITLLWTTAGQNEMKRNHYSQKQCLLNTALNLTEDIIPLQTVKAAFWKARELLNDKNGIYKEASSHPRIFSVKSFSNEKKPHRVSPKGKNQNHLQCD